MNYLCNKRFSCLNNFIAVEIQLINKYSKDNY